MKKISIDVRRLVKPIFAASMLAAVVLPASQTFGAVGTIPTPGFEPEGLVVGPTGTQNLYVAGNTAANVSQYVVINTQFNTITAGPLTLRNLNVAGHPAEHGATTIAENPAGTLVFIVNSTSADVSVISTVTNTQIATFSAPTIGPVPAGCRVSPNGKQLWTACLATPPSFNNGTVNITSIETANFGTPVGLVNTGSSPNEVVFNSKGSVAYVQNGSIPGNTGFIDEVNARKFPFKILRNNLGLNHLNNPNPVSMAITKDNSTLYVGDDLSDIVNLDIPTGDFDNLIFMFPGTPVADQQIGQVLVSPNQKFVVAAGTTLGEVTVAKTKTQLQTEYLPLPVGSIPYFMAFSPDGKILYVSNWNSAIPPVGGLESITGLTAP
jgi:YVTN family beta-propeller protein